MHKGAAAIIFLGPPGSGKGTQSARLAAALGWPAISTGEMLRREAQADTALGERVRAVLEAGRLFSDEEMNSLVAERLRREDCRRGFILDGYPRTLTQARFLDVWLVRLGVPNLQVFDFAVSAGELIERLKRRRQCPRCGRISSIGSEETGAASLCPVDRCPLIARADDQPAAIRERLRIYQRHAEPLVSHYRDRSYHLIAGGSSADAVTAHLLAFLEPAEKPSIRVAGVSAFAAV